MTTPNKQRAFTQGTTIYQKSIKPIPAKGTKSTGLRVLKPASTNNKVGKGSRLIQKGPANFRGKPLFNLTLIERATCPASCPQWEVCYGNNMPFAHRYKAGAKLEDALAKDLWTLNTKNPNGFVIRLHILGDFYSVKYVELWRDFLETYPHLALYGYTHRYMGTPIGDAVATLVEDYEGRVSILRSDSVDLNEILPVAMTVAKGDTPQDGIVVCPEQTGKTESCLTCGLCFNGRTSVQFLEH